MKRIAYIDSIKFCYFIGCYGHTFHDFKGINIGIHRFYICFSHAFIFIISGYLGYKKIMT